MGLVTNIEAALNTQLSTLANLPAVQWPNTDYTPVLGTTYIRPTFLPATGTLFNLSGSYKNTGMYQIDVYVPINQGIATLTGWLDSIQQLYANNKTLAAGTNTVYIQEIVIGREQRQDAWYAGMIEIHYICYS